MTVPRRVFVVVVVAAKSSGATGVGSESNRPPGVGGPGVVSATAMKAAKAAAAYVGSWFVTTASPAPQPGIPAAAAGALAPKRLASCKDRTEDESRFLETVDSIIAACKEFQKVGHGKQVLSSEVESWRVEVTIEGAKPPIVSLHRKANVKWMNHIKTKALTSPDELKFLARGLLRFSSKAGDQSAAAGNKEQDDVEEEIEAEAEQDADAELAEQKKKFKKKKKPDAGVAGKLDAPEDEKYTEVDVSEAKVKTKPAAKGALSTVDQSAHDPPPDFKKFDQGFNWPTDGCKKPGQPGFNDYAQKAMKENQVPTNPQVRAPQKDQEAFLNPYQQTSSFIAHPSMEMACGIAPRLLVAHCTGSGKTGTMIRICDNYFDDKRPKVVLFPTKAVCVNFYGELLSEEKFPNRYATFLRHEKLQVVLEEGETHSTAVQLEHTRDVLELKAEKLKSLGKGYGLKRGRVHKDMIANKTMPSAPLRAFTYAQAGTKTSCGPDGQTNAVFKYACPLEPRIISR